MHINTYCSPTHILHCTTPHNVDAHYTFDGHKSNSEHNFTNKLSPEVACVYVPEQDVIRYELSLCTLKAFYRRRTFLCTSLKPVTRGGLHIKDKLHQQKAGANLVRSGLFYLPPQHDVQVDFFLIACFFPISRMKLKDIILSKLEASKK